MTNGKRKGNIAHLLFVFLIAGRIAALTVLPAPVSVAPEDPLLYVDLRFVIPIVILDIIITDEAAYSRANLYCWRADRQWIGFTL
ncbi:MAG TPA: hypothetical protein PKA28_05480 [Methylomusa anaerophila]|uniref:hypothetical protein n=1 Tax=Methylomusa anaerophila TaxID=1930071 RepID=UPI000F831942|nr:hypothetical protein [Methylomusa anaerophila]HML87883.1 hypothetical protein [Methylomusa anaerophila]